MYDSPLKREKGGTERATGLVMDELNRRGHRAIGLLHINQGNPDEIFMNGKAIPSLLDFLSENEIDVVVNQIAFHDWLLKEFLKHGGEEWKTKGGKIVSVLHFPPILVPIPVKKVFKNFWQLSLIAKVKKLCLFFYLPFLQHKAYNHTKQSYKYVYNHSDLFVLLSASFIPKLVKLSRIKEKDKICIVPNMLTFPLIQNKSILDTKINDVLVVSRMEETQKKISKVLKVWEMTEKKDWRLVLIGEGIDLEQYKAYSKKHQLDSIVFMGQCSPLAHYEKAKIFLMTSDFEGWGLTLTESLQNGVVPIVIDTTPVFHDIIIDGVNGFLVSDEKEMAEKLNLLMLDSPLLYRMARNALSSATKFSPDKIGIKWEQLLKKL